MFVLIIFFLWFRPVYLFLYFMQMMRESSPYFFGYWSTCTDSNGGGNKNVFKKQNISCFFIDYWSTLKKLSLSRKKVPKQWIESMSNRFYFGFIVQVIPIGNFYIHGCSYKSNNIRGMVPKNWDNDNKTHN